jgi:hypothetical protein
MLFHVFDPANNLSAVTVKVDPGAIYLGPTNFIDPRAVGAIELSPIQASMLILALQNALETESELSRQNPQKFNQDGDEFL